MYCLSRSVLPLIAILLTVTGCTAVRETSPPRTATEQLLVSIAADEAAAQISLPIAKGTSVFVDATNFEGIDGKYAIAAIREQFLKQGVRMAPERSRAEVIVEIRAAALSTDEEEFLIGLPKFNVPIPLAGPVATPEFALFKRGEKRGVAKFIATAYTADTGEFIASSDPQFGFSHKREWKILFLFSWGRDNLLPDEYRPSRFEIEPPRLP